MSGGPGVSEAALNPRLKGLEYLDSTVPKPPFPRAPKAGLDKSAATLSCLPLARLRPGLITRTHWAEGHPGLLHFRQGCQQGDSCGCPRGPEGGSRIRHQQHVVAPEVEP